MSKYPSLMDLLSDLDCPDIDQLSSGQSTYKSEKTAREILQCIADVLRDETLKKLNESPFISILCDESTDISTQKKLIIYALAIDPQDLTVTTYYMANLKIVDGTGETLHRVICEYLARSGISFQKVLGLCTDSVRRRDWLEG